MSSNLGERIRVGLIGCGRHGRGIIEPALRLANIEVVASCSRHDTPLLAGMPHYRDHRQLLAAQAERLDACIVVLPAGAYGAVVNDILACGLPVWCEKPAATAVREAQVLEAAALRHGLPLAVGFNKRFASAYVMAKAAMNQPAFGLATSFFGKFMMGAGHYDDEAGYLIDNPVHMIDLARFFMGEVTEVSARRAALPEGLWSHAVTLRFASGAVGLLQFGNTQSWRQHNELVEITGRGCAIAVDNLIRYHYRPADGLASGWEPNFTVPAERNHSLVLAGYAGQFCHFADVVRGQATPASTMTDARRALEIIDEIRRQTAS